MEEVIRIQQLRKYYRQIKAVDDLSFTVNRGEVYGLLGQNGAGKSTIIRLLLTLVQPSGGGIQVFGMDLLTHRHQILKQVGAMIEHPDLYKYLSAFENLSIFAKLSGIRVSRDKVIEQLKSVGLHERAFDKVKTYSQGMKQRLGLAVALVHNPRLIILDEPTNGLDPQGIADVRNLILHLSRNDGKTILVSSHLLAEMELIADRMLIIDKGKKLVEGTIDDLFDPKKMLVTLEVNNLAFTKQKLQLTQWKKYIREEGKQSITFQMNKNEIPALTNELVNMGAEIVGLQPKHSLEDYFLSLTTANQHVDNFEH
jgi:ABC-2 type transport system ATP-binding protein